MGFFSNLFSGSAADPIEAIGDIIDEAVTTDEERAAAAQVMAKIKQAPAMAQAKINEIQAGHRSAWVSGARPAIMWVCALGFLQAFVINPNIAWLSGSESAPELPLDIMLELTIAMLGLSGLRTLEKKMGLTK